MSASQDEVSCHGIPKVLIYYNRHGPGLSEYAYPSLFSIIYSGDRHYAKSLCGSAGVDKQRHPPQHPTAGVWLQNEGLDGQSG